MTPLQRRALLFLGACIPSRIAFTVWSAKSQNPLLGALALLPAVGFFYFYLSGSRPTGAEVGGDVIWWNRLRPLHGILWGIFAVAALSGKPWAWKILAVDTVLGVLAFLTWSPASPLRASFNVREGFKGRRLSVTK